MARKPRWEFRLRLHGKPVFGIFVKEVGGGGVIAKPNASGRGIPHLHIYPRDGELHRHVTHEQYVDGRRHTQKGSVTLEELLHLFLKSLAPDDDPPPLLTSFTSKDEIAQLGAWFGCILARVVRPADDRVVHVLTGSLGDLLEKSVSGAPVTDWELDLTAYLAHEVERQPDQKLFEVHHEAELASLGRRVAFSEDLSKMVVLLPLDGLVMELSVDALQRASDALMETLGYAGYVRSLRRRGVIRLLREQAVSELTSDVEYPPRGP